MASDYWHIHTQDICLYLQLCLVKLPASTWHRGGKLQAQSVKSETRAEKELYSTSAFGILQIVLALPRYSLASCHFPGLQCQNCLCTQTFFFNCFITRLTYPHTQAHMLIHTLCIRGVMDLIHMCFILHCQIHLIPLLRTGLNTNSYMKIISKTAAKKDKRQKSQG